MSPGFKRVLAAPLLALSLASLPAFAGPTVVPTAEGQLGEAPGLIQAVLGNRIESIRGQPGNLILGGLLSTPAVGGSTSEMNFLTDMIHGYPEPVPIDSTAAVFDNGNVERQPPASARMRNAANDDDWVVFSYAEDGPMTNTMNINTVAFDGVGNPLATNTVTVDNGFPFPDPAMSKTGVAVDQQGRATVAYTEFAGGLPSVRAQRVDTLTGLVVDPDFLIDGLGNDAGVALLDPAGNRLLVTIGAGVVKGNIVDFTGVAPSVGPSIPISTTPGVPGNLNPAVAADPATGQSLVVWENLRDTPGNPVDIRGRRFDANGNPIGNDFVVNTTTVNAQGQPQVAYGPQSLSAVVWAGSGAQLPEDELDTFLQVYGPDGNPIGGEIRVNTTTEEFQDNPTVRFLPEPDAQGRPQVVVAWRDVGNQAGTLANGTGTGYKCFSIDGIAPPEQVIFADGFESGDTSSWSDTQP